MCVGRTNPPNRKPEEADWKPTTKGGGRDRQSDPNGNGKPNLFFGNVAQRPPLQLDTYTGKCAPR